MPSSDSAGEAGALRAGGALDLPQRILPVDPDNPALGIAPLLDPIPVGGSVNVAHPVLDLDYQQVPVSDQYEMVELEPAGFRREVDGDVAGFKGSADQAALTLGPDGL